MARDPHNYYAKVAIEAGLPGIAALLTAIAVSVWRAWQNRTENPQGWILAASAAVLAGHSVIDQTLSFGSITLLLWTLLGAASPPVSSTRWDQHLTWGGIATGLSTAVFAALLCAGSVYTNRAEALFAAGFVDEAKVAARQVTVYDPWDSRALLIVGDRPSLEKAQRLDPHLPEVHSQLSLELERQHDLDGALRQAKAALEAQPLVSVHYSRVAELAGRLMEQALETDDKLKAERLAEELVALGADFARRKSRAELVGRQWSGGADLRDDAGFPSLVRSGNLAAQSPDRKQELKATVLAAPLRLR